MGAELVTGGRDAARLSLVVFGFVAVQETVMLDLRIGGVHPDIMVLIPIVAGIIGGPSRGATIGFATGLVADLFLPTPFGLSALVGCLLGFGVGLATVAVDRTAWWLAPLVALGGSALYEVVYGVLGFRAGPAPDAPRGPGPDHGRGVGHQCRAGHPGDARGDVGHGHLVDRGDAHLRRSAWARPGDRRSRPRRATRGGRLGYWWPVSRSLRHPFGEKSVFRSPTGTRPARSKARQPKMRQSRFSVESILDAPDSTEARPGLRLRIVGITMVALFARPRAPSVGPPVLQAPAAAQAVTADQIRVVPTSPTRGPHPGPHTGTRWSTTWSPSRSPSPGWRPPRTTRRSSAGWPRSWGDPADSHGGLASSQFSLYKPVPVLSDAPLSDVLY